MKIWIIWATLLTTSLVSATEVVTLADGRNVLLKDDFTWEYVIENTQQTTTPESPNPPLNVSSEAVSPPARVAIPAVSNTVGTTLVVNSNKPTLQLSDSGVDILIGAASYEGGRLILPTSVTNQSSQSVIQVEMVIEVFDMSGNALAKETVLVWQSIKRMPDTYLRPQQALQGKSIQLALPLFQQYQLKASVTAVQTR